SAQEAQAGHPTYNVTLASNSWIDQHSEILDTFLSLEAWVADHADKDPEEFGRVNAGASGMDESSASRQIEGQRFIHGSEESRYLAELAEEIHATAKFLVEQGEIPSAKNVQNYEAATRPELWKDHQ
ncbi:MAG: taurine ABC transporter substrate-binding protein, partial [Corynebacterium variabile]